MKSKGFTWKDDLSSQTVVVTHWNDFLGLTDMSRASGYGYQSEDLATVRENERLTSQAPAPDSPEYLRMKAYVEAEAGKSVFDPNSSDRGCDGQIAPQLYSPKDGVNVSIQGELLSQAVQSAQSDSAVQAALGRWSTCMSKRGYQLAKPPLPISSAEVTQADIKKAIADVTCKGTSQLIDIYITTLYDNEARLIASHRGELEAYSAWLKKNAELARQALAQE